MVGSIWQGSRIRLRAIEPGDWEAFFAWSRDTENSRRGYQIPFPRSAEARRRQVEEQALQAGEGEIFHWAIEDLSGELVGSINTHTCNRRHGTFRYGLGVQPAWQRRGYASEAILLVLRYYFDELRYQKAGATVYSFNAPSIRLHERLGFQLEGRLRRELYTAGQYHDILVFGMTAGEFAAQHAAALPPVG